LGHRDAMGVWRHQHGNDEINDVIGWYDLDRINLGWSEVSTRLRRTIQ
jgi:hypothetical protein